MPDIPAVSHRALIQCWYVDHHDWLQSWLRRRMGSGPDAADLTQDTYERLIRKSADELDGVREPRAFLTRVAKSLAANLYRRRCVEEAFVTSIAHFPQAQEASPEEQAIVLEALVELDAHLAALPELVRKAFLLSQLDDMRQTDIAAELGISLATVKRHIARAVVHVCLLSEAQP